MYNLEDNFLYGKCVINCKTDSEAVILYSILEDKGIRWVTGERLSQNKILPSEIESEGDMCFMIEQRRLSHGPKISVLRRDLPIYSMEDFLDYTIISNNAPINRDLPTAEEAYEIALERKNMIEISNFEDIIIKILMLMKKGELSTTFSVLSEYAIRKLREKKYKVNKVTEETEGFESYHYVVSWEVKNGK